MSFLPTRPGVEMALNQHDLPNHDLRELFLSDQAQMLLEDPADRLAGPPPARTARWVETGEGHMRVERTVLGRPATVYDGTLDLPCQDGQTIQIPAQPHPEHAGPTARGEGP
jgi:hypothetical protein